MLRTQCVLYPGIDQTAQIEQRDGLLQWYPSGSQPASPDCKKCRQCCQTAAAAELSCHPGRHVGDPPGWSACPARPRLDLTCIRHFSTEPSAPDPLVARNKIQHALCSFTLLRGALATTTKAQESNPSRKAKLTKLTNTLDWLKLTLVVMLEAKKGIKLPVHRRFYVTDLFSLHGWMQ